MIVDGHIKSDSKTKEGVEKGARELKGRFPMLQIKVYDAEAKRSEEIALADAQFIQTQVSGGLGNRVRSILSLQNCAIVVALADICLPRSMAGIRRR